MRGEALDHGYYRLRAFRIEVVFRNAKVKEEI